MEKDFEEVSPRLKKRQTRFEQNIEQRLARIEEIILKLQSAGEIKSGDRYKPFPLPPRENHVAKSNETIDTNFDHFNVSDNGKYINGSHVFLASFWFQLECRSRGINSLMVWRSILIPRNLY